MQNLYQVIFVKNIDSDHYSSVVPVFNSLDLTSATKKAYSLVNEYFLIDNLYDFSCFKVFDLDFFSKIHHNSNYESYNVYIIEVKIDSTVNNILFDDKNTPIVWKINKNIAMEIFTKKIIEAYNKNKLYFSEIDAKKLFYSIVNSPENYFPDFNIKNFSSSCNCGKDDCSNYDNYI